MQNERIGWQVLFSEKFEAEYDELPRPVRNELISQLRWIRLLGPNAGRPRVDTLKGSGFSNMKELRLDADDGAWRFAFAFDPARRAVMLVAGDKSGISERSSTSISSQLRTPVSLGISKGYQEA